MKLSALLLGLPLLAGPALLAGLAARPAPAALAPAAPRPEVALRYAPEAGARLARTSTTSWRASLEEIQVVMNDTPVPSEFLPPMELDLSSELRVEVRDEVRALRRGAPEVLARTFVDVAERTGSRFTMEGAPDEAEDGEATSELVGRTVRFTWNADAEAYDRRFEDASGDPGLLEGLAEDMDLRAFLPPGPVAVGTSWEVEPEAFRAVARPGGDLGVVRTVQPREEVEELPVEGTVRLTLAGVEEREGRRLATVEVAAEVELATVYLTSLEQVPVTDGTAQETFTLRLDVEGRLVWDLDAGHLRSLRLAGPADVEIDTIKDLELSPEDPAPYESTLHLLGEWTATAEVER